MAGRVIVCATCDGVWPHAFGGECAACAQYRYRTGLSRPAYLYAPLSWCCAACGTGGRHFALGRCRRCYDRADAPNARLRKRAQRARQRAAAA